MRIALANLPYPTGPAESVEAASKAMAEAARAGAGVVCFPEAFVPGYRGMGHAPPRADPRFLETAWKQLGAAARQHRIAAIVGTERLVGSDLRLSALVLNPDGSIAGFQDKVQLDPSEDATYAAGSGRSMFQVGPLTFGVAICHEGWRYPETVRWAAQRGAHVVFHPHFHQAETGSHRPRSFGEPQSTFHEKAMLCRAAENTCYFASVNCASPGSPTTSAVVAPDGTLVAYQPYGKPGLLVADLDLALATGLLARRFKPPG